MRFGCDWEILIVTGAVWVQCIQIIFGTEDLLEDLSS